MSKQKQKNYARSQAGQTLIETIVAIFVLTMAITAALGVAIYAISTSSTSTNQIIASSLAREGVEIARTMRDSNWLAGDVAGGAYDLQSCADIGGKLCYPQAYGGPSYYIGEQANNILVFNPAAKSWAMQAGGENYALYLQADGTYTHTANSSSIFARKIVVTRNNSSPYTAQNPELIIQSIVGWSGKNCTAMTGTDPETTNCRIVVEEHLTNWKDYK